jgi:hypothetical protein
VLFLSLSFFAFNHVVILYRFKYLFVIDFVETQPAGDRNVGKSTALFTFVNEDFPTDTVPTLFEETTYSVYFTLLCLFFEVFFLYISLSLSLSQSKLFSESMFGFANNQSLSVYGNTQMRFHVL